MMNRKPPYRRIAVASAFSPRFEQVLAEAKRARDRLGGELHLIYVGKRDRATDERFRTALAALQLPEDSPVHYHEGSSAADAILEAVRESQVELIVAGALEKQVVLRPFLGNVARRLVREASCSVMLFTMPAREPQRLRRIVFYVPGYSRHVLKALRSTLRLAELEGCEELFVIRVYTTFDAARASRRARGRSGAGQPGTRTLEEEEEALDRFIESAGETKVPIESRCIQGNTGFAASDFVQTVGANLLVVPVEDGSGQGELPPQISWVTDVIPCNLWVIR